MTNENYQLLILAASSGVLIGHLVFLIRHAMLRNTKLVWISVRRFFGWAAISFLGFLVAVGLCAAGCPAEPFPAILAITFVIFSIYRIGSLWRMK